PSRAGFAAWAVATGRPVRLLAAGPRAAAVAGRRRQRGGEAGLEGARGRALARGWPRTAPAQGGDLPLRLGRADDPRPAPPATAVRSATLLNMGTWVTSWVFP